MGFPVIRALFPFTMKDSLREKLVRLRQTMAKRHQSIEEFAVYLQVVRVVRYCSLAEILVELRTLPHGGRLPVQKVELPQGWDRCSCMQPL